MSKTKPLLAIGIILLFIGLSCSPIMGKSGLKEEFELGVIGENGRISAQTIKLTADKIREFEGILAQLTEEMEEAEDYDQLLNIVEKSKIEWGRFPIINLILELIGKFLRSTHTLGQLRPLRRDAFVMSWGFGSKLNPFKENKLKILVPMKLWYYTGRGPLYINSRTLVVDPYPFSIKSLTGRQAGFMRNFVGLYIYRHNTLTDKTYTFMLGRAGTIRGFDLSPFNVWKQ
jgi:hypothetical protein